MTDLTETQKTHYRKILESTYLGSHDMLGPDGNAKPFTLKIDGACREEIFCPDSGKNETRLVVTFLKAKKPWICNRTNADRISEIHGPFIEDWHGKEITLEVKPVRAFGKITDAIRVRPKTASLKDMK